jgi:hypothetical protein
MKHLYHKHLLLRKYLRRDAFVEIESKKGQVAEVAYRVAKGTISAVPIVGGLLSELLPIVIAEPLQKRRDRFVLELSRRLEALEDRIEGYSIQQWLENDTFLSILLRAFPIALRNHQKFKIDALVNAVTNSTIHNDTDESKKFIFLSLVDTLSEWHIKLLSFFVSPKHYCDPIGEEYPSFALRDMLPNLVEKVFPDLTGEIGFYSYIISDLYYKGLTSTNSLAADIQKGDLTIHPTSLGVEFIQFISET